MRFAAHDKKRVSEGAETTKKNESNRPLRTHTERKVGEARVGQERGKTNQGKRSERGKVVERSGQTGNKRSDKGDVEKKGRKTSRKRVENEKQM